MQLSEELRNEFTQVVRAARRLAKESSHDVDEILELSKEEPLDAARALDLLQRIIVLLRESAAKRKDTAVIKNLEGDIDALVGNIMTARQQATRRTKQSKLSLVTHNGVEPSPVLPRPVFHRREVNMMAGWVKLSDLALWGDNLRLEIHLAQWGKKTGRKPTPEELRDIMLGKAGLEGAPNKDEFQITELARSIAVNGVRRPPILDMDGTLLDGNRRVTACYYILHSDEFTPEQKKRVEYIFVWQLTEFSSPDEREAVIVSLNFEDDCKIQWPQYVRARKVYEEWQAMCLLEPRAPATRQAQMKRELSEKFALGPNTATVNRYLKMVQWANDFEEYHVGKNRDPYEVKHGANKYFEYFDELSKGTKPGGVAYTLEQDETFKHLVFDLLLEGKFRNWAAIRHLNSAADNQTARGILIKARDTKDEDEAQDKVDDAIAIAKQDKAEARELGADDRIERFVNFLEALPLRAFSETIKPRSIKRLHDALSLVRRVTTAASETPSKA